MTRRTFVKMHVCFLPRAIQRTVAQRLLAVGIYGEDFERAIFSKLIDLEDTIEIGDLL